MERLGWCGFDAFGTAWIRGMYVFISAWTGMGGLGSCRAWGIGVGSANDWGSVGLTYLICLWWRRFGGVGQVGRRLGMGGVYWRHGTAGEAWDHHIWYVFGGIGPVV